MAQTWPITNRKIIALRVVDTLAAPLYLVVRRLSSRDGIVTDTFQRILVVELWHIGDVVLSTTALRVLRRAFPSAKLTLLAKPYAAELLANSDLVDEIVVFDFPWTASSGKYDPRRYHMGEIAALVRQLRAERFDLSVDVRMDIRSNLLTCAIGAKRRLGYDFGGGSGLLTDRVPASPDSNHKVMDWLMLLRPLIPGLAEGVTNDESFAPILTVTREEQESAQSFLREHGVQQGDTIVGIHPGASVGRRRWPLANFGQVADRLAERHGTKTLVFVDPEGVGADLQLRTPPLFARGALREFMALVSLCDVLVCNDSGPMHIADALGVWVVGVFTTGNPRWHRPYREGQRFVGRGTGHQILDYPTVGDVLAAAEAAVSVDDVAGPAR